jgi:hypothetical protein
MIASAETAPRAADVIIERLLIIVLSPLEAAHYCDRTRQDTRTFVSEGSNQSPVNKTFSDC